MIDDARFRRYLHNYKIEGLKNICSIFLLEPTSEVEWRTFLISNKFMTRATKKLRIRYHYQMGRVIWTGGRRDEPDYRAYTISIYNGRNETLLSIELEESDVYAILNGDYDERARTIEEL